MKGKNVQKESKRLGECTRPLLEDANYGPKKNDSRNFGQMSFRIVWFCHKLYITFFIVNNFCFQLPQNVPGVNWSWWNNARSSGLRLSHYIFLARTVTYQFSILLIVFSKQCFVGNIQGKFHKNCSVTFISEDLP